jgi:hypothetical protein
MVSFQPKWARMILSGEKKYEFRQGNFVNAKTGDKFLILESLGQKKSLRQCGFCNNHCDKCKHVITGYSSEDDYCDLGLDNSGFAYQKALQLQKESIGTGKVIGEFIVGEVYDDMYVIEDKLFWEEGYKGELSEWYIKEQLEGYPRLKDLDIGYTDQPLAFEITQLKVYDTPRDKSEFIIESKIKKRLELYNKNTDDIFTLKSAITNMGIPKDCFVKRSPQSFCRVIDTI